jgi:hypothetical protein
MMGRNFDFPSAVGVIMHCIPDNGYESITTFNAEFYGFGDDFKPEGFKNQYMSLTGLFFALDGINEKGLAIADLMAGDTIQTHQRTDKPDLTTSAAICYLLKNAAKHVAQGDIVIKYDCKRRGLHVSISYMGIGQAELVGTDIYSFLQKENALSEVNESSALGISISRAIVEVLGGEFYLDTENDKKTVASFWFPCEMKDLYKDM